MLEVVEKFISINGEGPCAGELAAFIRFKGCNLNCSYCDTKWANIADTPASYMTAEELCQWVMDSGIKNVTLTGGEPMLQKELPDLCRKLSGIGCRTEIETNGSISIHELAGKDFRPVFTMDYKLPSSGMESFMLEDNLNLLETQDTVKFVSGSRKDLMRALQIIEKYDLVPRCHVYISPVFGMIEPSEIVEFMQENKLNGVRLQLQLHKFIWDPDRRGV